MHSRGADRRKSTAGFSSEQSGIPFDRRKNSERRRNGFISHLQLFAAIPYEAVESLLQDCDTHDVAAGSVLLEPGQFNDSIHLLISGRLRIHLDRVDSADYIAIEEGGCVGELSIIDGQPASAYVVADTPSRVLKIHQSVFWERLIPQPGVARNLLNTLSERMRANRDMIIERLKDKLALEHLQKELSIARNIQMSMLPPGARLFPERDEAIAYALMEAAKDVGGDFYDAFFVTPERLFVAVGDVSGKGVAAALFMARTITQLRIEAARKSEPSEIVEAVNCALSESNDAGMFVTVFCGILDITSGEFSFANAGHNPPVRIGADGRHDFLAVKKGIVAGMIESAVYPMDSIRLRPDESLLLYTDGVTEAMNPVGQFYSEQRLLDTIRLAGCSDPRVLVESVRASIAAFTRTAPQADDITMLALQYRRCSP